MDTFKLEHMVVSFRMDLIGKTQFDLPFLTAEDKVDSLPVFLDDAQVDVYCVRWSNRPDVVAGTFKDALPGTFETGKFSDASDFQKRAIAHLRRIYSEKGIPWPAE